MIIRKSFLISLILLLGSSCMRAMNSQKQETLNKQLFAAVSGKKELSGKVAMLLVQGANPDAKKFDPPLNKALTHENQKDTPLHVAIRNGYLMSAQLLLEENAQINVQNMYGSTSLHEAIWLPVQLALRAIQLLDNYGADFDAEDEDGNTPLSLAKKQKNFAVVKKLIQLGAIK